MVRKSLSSRRRLGIFEVAKGLCHLCGQRIKAGEKWEVEHRIALALGGADEDVNLAPAHIACHAIKTKDDVGRYSKALRQRAKHLGIRSAGWPKSKWKRKVNGETVLRNP